MKLERLLLHGMFAYEGVVDLDVGAIGPGLIAVTGANGSGKSALLELVPAVNYQKLPARDNDHPKAYATARDARLEYWYADEAGDRYRAVLSLDCDADGVDGLFEYLAPDGQHAPLNDGKVSTLKKVVAERFPSYELFINSNFAAQGRGDEFARTPDSKKKDLFAQFLGLAGLLDKAQTAAAAAAIVSQARDRAIVLREALAEDTAPAVEVALAARVTELQALAAAAAAGKAQTDTYIAHLETHLASMQDAVAAHGVATQRVTTVTAQLTGRRLELARAHEQRAREVQLLADDVDRAKRKCVSDLADIQTKLAGNEQLRGMRAQILAAVPLVTSTQAQIAQLRTTLAAARTGKETAETARRTVEQQLAALLPVEQRHARSVRDAALLLHVPCEGAEPYAGCQFLQDATAAQAQIEALATQLAPKAALADHVGQHTRDVATHATAIAKAEAAIAHAEIALAQHQKLAADEAPLKASDDRVAELNALHLKVKADSDAAIAELQARHDRTIAELDARIADLTAAIVGLERELAAAQADLDAVRQGNQAATDAQQKLAGARAELERLISNAATAASGLADIDRQRQELQRKRDRLAGVARRLAALDQALVDWRDLAKHLGKGGLTDLEIDTAGPEITALANTLLLHCLQGQFSLELVTQVAKKDGDGVKDEFTVRVMDNLHAPGTWRELKALSGGQRTVVQEALMCAIALYVNQRSPMPLRTLWRDETGAALDAVNALQYVEMLRKVLEIGQLHQILFVSHNAEAAAMADAQIVVADGQARIVLPPFGRSEAA